MRNSTLSAMTSQPSKLRAPGAASASKPTPADSQLSTPPTSTESSFNSNDAIDMNNIRSSGRKVLTPIQKDIALSPPPSAEAKRWEEVPDKENARVDELLSNILKLGDLDKDVLTRLLTKGEGRSYLPFEVSQEEFDDWRKDKEDIGGFEYDSSLKNIIIKANGGPIHELTVGVMFSWLKDLTSRHSDYVASLAPRKLFVMIYFISLLIWLQHSLLKIVEETPKIRNVLIVW
jgi:hypothetical protein